VMVILADQNLFNQESHDFLAFNDTKGFRSAEHSGRRVGGPQSLWPRHTALCFAYWTITATWDTCWIDPEVAVTVTV
jgi:hypothetical protein